jgi:hypothetical protein
MNKEEHLKNLFNFLKSRGYYSEYATFEEFEEKKLGIKKQSEKEKQEDFKKWKNTLSPKDRAEFEYIFGND